MKFLWKIASVAGAALATYVVVISVYLVVSITVSAWNKQEVPQPSKVPVAEEELKVFVQPWVLRSLKEEA